VSNDVGTTGYDLTDNQDRDDRRKHLELVSAVVARMATASAAAKGWSITLAGAAFGVAIVRDKWYLILLGILALILFGILDGFYLHNEKRFRDLYDAIAIDNAVTPLSMDLSGVKPRSRNESLVSWSVLGFYGPLVLGGLVLLAAALCHAGSEASETSLPTQPAPSVTITTTTVTEMPREPTPALPSSTTASMPPQTTVPPVARTPAS
jgi:hypothetical protein